ncbi:GntR family transcriptional repressor for pyruvate dehydrogenase complex [Pullulanibacillus pueri]|uniref:HTH-type transcriptional regulator LutR n=1 Tax=Pullulanibacillus pueri TaxID=1437324 RepID=A0A8J3EM34_9BACL|nr:FadR/GntR family transcriptional regulator [Pullulanibacillus pueri]MBM7682374.1 GntR family transcriptional repressor for pyruvate dehydrogenase complex [Pullulanibacillus pueri]GGH81889.1 HTH-type transcriptional regulator LutR [Pullulanibacillus pueri]
MEYKKIKSKKIYEVVIDELLQMISTGKLRPGDKVASVQQLAENFQVGRSAIREALSALRVMGLVEMRQGEGTYIREHSPRALAEAMFNTLLMKEEDIKELLEVRKILEVGAVSAAAQHWNEHDLLTLETALEEMQTAGNEELGEKADFAFHMAIAKASQNSLLVHLMTNVSEIMVEAMRETRKLWLFSQETTVEKIYQEHREIFQAVKERNATLAQERMLSHLERVEETLLNKPITGKS